MREKYFFPFPPLISHFLLLIFMRSSKKGPYIDQKLLKKVKKQKPEDGPIKTWARDSMISPEMIGYTFLVHNGKDFIPVKVVEEMVGHRLGEFALTRKPVKHSAPGVGATRSSAFLSVK